MIIEMEVKGYWRQHEAEGAARQFLNLPARVETQDGIVRVIIDEIAPGRETALRDYFENHPYQDMPQAELDALVAADTRRDELITRIQAIWATNPPVPVVWDVIRALAELVGVEP